MAKCEKRVCESINGVPERNSPTGMCINSTHLLSTKIHHIYSTDTYCTNRNNENGKETIKTLNEEKLPSIYSKLNIEQHIKNAEK